MSRRHSGCLRPFPELQDMMFHMHHLIRQLIDSQIVNQNFCKIQTISRRLLIVNEGSVERSIDHQYGKGGIRKRNSYH